VNELTLVPADPCFAEPGRIPEVMSLNYDGFTIESFEAGRGLWHARIRRADLRPVVLDGVSFASLEVGFAWSSPDAALADAKTQVDHLNQRVAAERSAT
jgi:hypothetical protein